MSAPSTRFFRLEDVAKNLDVSPRTVRRWIDAKQLPVHRFGKVLRIHEGDLRAFIAQQRQAA